MKYLDELKEYEAMKPGLSRIKKFLIHCGNPHKKLKFIHIAGTNGKGSTAAYIAEILKQNGYKTALYTSPHLIDITERIKINGRPIPLKTLNSIIKKEIEFAKKCRLSFFEILTAAAFIYFKSQKIDIAVLETGLGGAFDATNIIENPYICIITSISKDHTEILGSSLKKIAEEKAGIIKKGADVIASCLPLEALKEIEKKAPPEIFGKDFKTSNYKLCKNYQSFDFYFKDRLFLKNVKTKMLGRHQMINASLALAACVLLKKRNLSLKKSCIKKSLFNVKIPARFDNVSLTFNKILNKNNAENPYFAEQANTKKNLGLKDKKTKFIDRLITKLIIDGSHNEESVSAFIKLWRALKYDKDKTPFVFALMKEKNYKNIIKASAPLMSRVILPDIKNPRALDFEILKKEFLKYLDEKNIIKAASSKDALNLLKNTPVAAAMGSLYLAGDIYKTLEKQKRR